MSPFKLFETSHHLSCGLHYQTVRFTPDQMERLIPCAARTSSQFSLVLGISSSDSGLGRAPSLGLATTRGSGPR